MTGLVGALIATAARIGWSSSDGRFFRCRDGYELDLLLDPLAVVSETIHEAARKWQIANIVNAFLGLGGSVDIAIDPICKLLNAKHTLFMDAAAQEAPTLCSHERAVDSDAVSHVRSHR